MNTHPSRWIRRAVESCALGDLQAQAARPPPSRPHPTCPPRHPAPGGS